MIGLFFELIEWSIKLMVVALVIAFRLMFWLLKLAFIATAALVSLLAEERARRAQRR
jgi:hypothetical protein